LSEPRLLRFAVGAFESSEDLDRALQELQLGGMASSSVSYLALERVLAAKVTAARSDIRQLAFPEQNEPLACTAGPLAECLWERLLLGAISLKDALGRWLIPRHAAHLQRAVESGSVLMWLRLADADEERRACQCLLAHSSNSVGVHDLSVGPTPSNGTPR
jgi:hypothetical protein